MSAAAGPHISVVSEGLSNLSINKRVVKEKNRFSSFLVTTNTNYRPSTDAESYEMGAKLEAALKEAFTQKGFAHFVKFLEPGHSWTPQFIKDVNVKFAVELGHDQRGRRIHAHSLIHIKHRSKIRIDTGKLKSLLTELMGDAKMKNMYINVRIVTTDRNLEEYLSKGVPEESNNYDQQQDEHP
jgi:hypothetical protein